MRLPPPPVKSPITGSSILSPDWVRWFTIFGDGPDGPSVVWPPASLASAIIKTPLTVGRNTIRPSASNIEGLVLRSFISGSSILAPANWTTKGAGLTFSDPIVQIDGATDQTAYGYAAIANIGGLHIESDYVISDNNNATLGGYVCIGGVGIACRDLDTALSPNAQANSNSPRGAWSLKTPADIQHFIGYNNNSIWLFGGALAPYTDYAGTITIDVSEDKGSNIYDVTIRTQISDLGIDHTETITNGINNSNGGTNGFIAISGSYSPEADPLGNGFQVDAIVSGVLPSALALEIRDASNSNLAYVDWEGGASFQDLTITGFNGVLKASDGVISDNAAVMDLAHVATATIFGRNTAGTGAPEVLTVLPTAVQNGITRLGTIVSGVWNGSTISTSYTAAQVTSISGTANRITVAGTATIPTIDISTSYVGQATITTLGTIATGTWSATAIGTTKGGTGLTSYTSGDLLYASASNVLSKLAVGADGFILTLASGLPTWAAAPAGSTAANPTASVGLTAVNGSATTYMRSDAAPPINQAIAPTWTGVHLFSVPDNTTIAWEALEGSNVYIKIKTTNAAESIVFGNATTNPLFTFLGTGLATFAGAVTVTGALTGTLTGNASTATALQTARTINTVSFDGTGNIVVTAAAGTLTGATLNATVLASSLTSVGTLLNLTVTNTITGSVSGNAATVTTNANLTGPITSVGNAASIASQTGTGTTFMMSASPTTTGTLTAAAANFSGAVSTAGLTATTGNFSSSIRIGGAPGTTVGLRVNGVTLTGNAQVGALFDGPFNLSATTRGNCIGANFSTDASAFTMTDGMAIRIGSPGIGAGSTVTNLYGIKIENQTGGGSTWALYTGTGLVHFGDAVDLSTTLAVTGVTTFTAQPIVSSLTASQAVFTDSSKGLVSNAISGSGSVLMSASPTTTGTLTAAAANFSGAVSTAGLTATTGEFSSVIRLGGTPGTTVGLRVNGLTLTSATQVNALFDGTFNSSATTRANCIGANFGTAAAAFTLTDGMAIRIGSPGIGAGSTVTNLYGIKIENQSGGATLSSAITTGTGVIQFGDNLKLITAGSGLYVKEGANATSGVATLVLGTVVVSTTKVTANSRIYLTNQALGTITVPTGLAVSARTAGTSFTILSSNLTDTSSISWLIVEPA